MKKLFFLSIIIYSFASLNAQNVTSNTATLLSVASASMSYNLWLENLSTSFKQNTAFNNSSSLVETKASEFDFEVITRYFEQSNTFSEGNNFIWIDYQLVSTKSSESDVKSTLTPPLGINFEKRIFFNLGLTASYSLNRWKEDNVLVESGATQFTEEFKYFYHSIFLGLNWHIAISEKIDPYFGLSYSYRYMKATCACYTVTKSSRNIDLRLGLRFLLTNRIFVMGEESHTGVGYFKLGLGYKFGGSQNFIL